MIAVPVHCDCGWNGWRTAGKIKARPCPNCDGEVRRWRKLENQVEISNEIATDEAQDTPLEQWIADTRAPVPLLPNPYYLRSAMGEGQVFRCPPLRGAKRRRRR